MYQYNPEKLPEEAFLISDAVLSALVNDIIGTYKFQSSDRFSRSGTESSKSSPSLQAGNQPQAEPSVEDIEPVPVFGPLSKQRKYTVAVLKDKKHLSQAKMFRQE
jgi:hypothetical protein